jgi:hypothetical protein
MLEPILPPNQRRFNLASDRVKQSAQLSQHLKSRQRYLTGHSRPQQDDRTLRSAKLLYNDGGLRILHSCVPIRTGHLALVYAAPYRLERSPSKQNASQGRNCPPTIRVQKRFPLNLIWVNLEPFVVHVDLLG